MKQTLYMLKGVFITCIVLSIHITCKGQSHSQIAFDETRSEYIGAQNIITLHNALYSFEDKHIRDTLFNESMYPKRGIQSWGKRERKNILDSTNISTYSSHKIGGFYYRMFKLLLVDAPIDWVLTVSQHEVFGHGARFREFGFEKNSFNVGILGGFARYGTLRDGYKSPTPQEYSAIHFSGVESTMLLANNITYRVLLNDTLHYREALLFLFSQNGLASYLRTTKTADSIEPGDDMANYINRMNYLFSNSNSKSYTIKKLYNQRGVSYANPLQAYSAFSILYTYLFKGEKQMNKIPMIRFGNVRYLPALNYSLTPFGSQYHFVNYVRYKKMLFCGDFNLGDNTFNTFYGFSVRGFNVVNTKRITMNCHVDVWNQPELELEIYSSINPTNKIGQAFKIDFILRPFKGQNRVGLFLQTGYKTKGYIMGEVLAESAIFRIGLSKHL